MSRFILLTNVALVFSSHTAQAQEESRPSPLELRTQLKRTDLVISPAPKDQQGRSRFQPGNEVVLVVEVKNTSKGTLTLVGPPEPALKLTGPRQESVQTTGGRHFFVAQKKQWKLEPGKQLSVLLAKLEFRQGDGQFQAAWLEPGDYRLDIAWNFAVSPPPPGTPLIEDRFDQTKEKDGLKYGELKLVNPPLKFNVRPGNPLDFWVKALDDQDEQVRQAAVAVLKDRGPAASAAALPLARRLNKESAATMLAILQALEVMDKRAQSTAPAIQELLGDGDPTIRAAAAKALPRVAPDAKDTGPALVPLLGDGIADVRRAAAEAFHHMGHHGWRPTDQETTALISALNRDPDSGMRYHVLHALYHAPEDRVVAAIVPILKESEESIRSAALYSLGRMATWLPREVKEKKDGAVKQLLDQLIDMLLSKDKLEKSTCEAVAYILSNLRESAAPAVPALRTALKYPHFQGKDSLYHPRTRLLMALRDIGPPALAAAPDLAERLLKDTDWSTRAYAAEALGGLGPQAPKECRAALVQALDEKMGQVRNAAVQALGKMEAVPELIVALRHQDDEIRNLATNVLFPLGPKAAPTFPVLAEMAVSDKAVGPRRSAAHVLGSLMADSTIPQLIKALDDPDDQVRRYAARSLGQFGKKSKNALDPLLARLPKETNGEARQAAAVALWNIGLQGHTKGAEELIPLLDDSQAGTPQMAILLLEQLGPRAQAAIPALRRLAAKDSGVLGKQAAEAVRKIEMK